MNSRFTPALAITILVLAGCSGGAGDSGSSRAPTLPPGSAAPPSNCGSAIIDPVPDLDCASLDSTAPAASVDALPGGYWWGRFADETQAVQGYMSALVGEDGRFQMQAFRYNDTNLCHNWEAELGGTMVTDGNAMSGSGRIIAVISSLADGTRAADLQVDGVVAERDSIRGAWNASSGDSGCFLLDSYWASDYETPSALENLVGAWTDHNSVNTAQLSVEADGTLTGSDQSGCSWTGRFGLIDDHYSIYEFVAELQSCSRAGQYTGLAWHGLGWDPGEYWLLLLANDGAQALIVGFSNR